MSTNTALDQIKNRAEKAVDARLECNNAETDAQEESLSIRAVFIAEQSSYDVPKLLAALEAVEALHHVAEGFALPTCSECAASYPCQTITAIEEALR